MCMYVCGWANGVIDRSDEGRVTKEDSEVKKNK